MRSIILSILTRRSEEEGKGGIWVIEEGIVKEGRKDRVCYRNEGMSASETGVVEGGSRTNILYVRNRLRCVLLPTLPMLYRDIAARMHRDNFSKASANDYDRGNS